MAHELLIGRFQPFHNGHVENIQRMTNPAIAVVRGEKVDIKRNPIGFDCQRRLINKVFPNVPVFEVDTDYIPDVLGTLAQKGISVDTIYSGPDRIRGYKSQVDDFNSKAETPLEVNFKEARKVYSGKAVRDAIRANDERQYRQLMPQTLWVDYDTLKIMFKLNEEILSMFEEGEVANTTSGIQGSELPVGTIFKRVTQKRKQRLEELNVPNEESGLNKKRHRMPQITDHESFMGDLRSNGHKFEEVSKNPLDLIPTQGEFNEDKVKALMKSGTTKPAVISNDGYIVDGHHRWLANCENDVKECVCFEVDMSIDDVLEFLKGKPYVSTKKINEGVK